LPAPETGLTEDRRVENQSSDECEDNSAPKLSSEPVGETIGDYETPGHTSARQTERTIGWHNDLTSLKLPEEFRANEFNIVFF
jgi:hypothetical protein